MKLIQKNMIHTFILISCIAFTINAVDIDTINKKYEKNLTELCNQNQCSNKEAAYALLKNKYGSLDTLRKDRAIIEEHKKNCTNWYSLQNWLPWNSNPEVEKYNVYLENLTEIYDFLEAHQLLFDQTEQFLHKYGKTPYEDKIAFIMWIKQKMLLETNSPLSLYKKNAFVAVTRMNALKIDAQEYPLLAERINATKDRINQSILVIEEDLKAEQEYDLKLQLEKDENIRKNNIVTAQLLDQQTARDNARKIAEAKIKAEQDVAQAAIEKTRAAERLVELEKEKIQMLDRLITRLQNIDWYKLRYQDQYSVEQVKTAIAKIDREKALLQTQFYNLNNDIAFWSAQLQEAYRYKDLIAERDTRKKEIAEAQKINTELNNRILALSAQLHGMYRPTEYDITLMVQELAHFRAEFAQKQNELRDLLEKERRILAQITYVQSQKEKIALAAQIQKIEDDMKKIEQRIKETLEKATAAAQQPEPSAPPIDETTFSNQSRK